MEIKRFIVLSMLIFSQLLLAGNVSANIEPDELFGNGILFEKPLMLTNAWNETGPNVTAATDGNIETYVTVGRNTTGPTGTDNLVRNYSQGIKVVGVRYRVEKSGMIVTLKNNSGSNIDALEMREEYNDMFIPFEGNNVRKFHIINMDSSDVKLYEVELYDEIPNVPPPSPPTGLIADATSEKVVLSWNTNQDVQGYNVYRNGQKINGRWPITTPEYVDTGLDNGTTYTYQIRAVGYWGHESAPATVYATPKDDEDLVPPNPPQNLTGTPGPGMVILSWDANTEPDLQGYNIYRNGQKINFTTIKNVNFTITGLKNDEEYEFYVTAVDMAGNESEPSNIIYIKPEPEPFRVTFIPNGDAIVVQVSGGVMPYQIIMDDLDETFESTSYVIRNLEMETDYTITVKDNIGNEVTETINTGSEKGYIPPNLPNPMGIFQHILNNFGTAAYIGFLVILSAVSLGIIIVLGLFAWRLTKKWIATSK